MSNFSIMGGCSYLGELGTEFIQPLDSSILVLFFENLSRHESALVLDSTLLHVTRFSVFPFVSYSQGLNSEFYF